MWVCARLLICMICLNSITYVGLVDLSCWQLFVVVCCWVGWLVVLIDGLG